MIKNRVSMYDQLQYYNDYLAPKYFDMENLDTSRLGLFGYINELMADTTSDVINENSVLFNEIFFKKAQIPESILSYAAQYRIEDINAKPAKMEFAIAINEASILARAQTDNSGNDYFIIDSDSEIFVEENFKYMLDYDIKINIRKTAKSGYIYSAQYIMNKENKLSDLTSPYIKVTKQRNNNSYYLYLIVTARQLSKSVIEQTIFTEDQLSYISKDFKYDGNLADFNVYYKRPDSDKFEQIQKLIIDSAPVDGNFCYYQYGDENTITISFSTLARHFRPEFNSILKLEIFTTDGTRANFEYNGNNVRMDLKSEKYDYNQVIALAYSISKSDGGHDKSTFEELKDFVSYFASTCYNISTTLDLDKYFSRLPQSDNNSKLTFVKKRDDILDRLFGAFMLMKDQNNTIIPSNTVDVHLNNTMFDDQDENLKRYVIKAGSKLTYLPDSYDVTKVTEFKETDKFKYSNPFVLVLNKQPLSVSYYLNSINREYITDFNYINDAAFYQFITNRIKITRDAINGEDKYKIEFTVVPNLSDIDFDFANLNDKDLFVSSNGKIRIFAQFSNKVGDATYYTEATMVGYDKATKEMKFNIELQTDDYISATNKLRIINSLKDNGKVLDEILIEATESVFNLLVFYNEQEEHVPHHGYETIIPESAGLQLTNSYILTETINLINDMTDIMRSTVVVKLLNGETKEYEYIVRNVPLTNYDYIKNRHLAQDFIQNVFTNTKNIRESLKLITNNFNIDFKLYNTYGKSKYFYILNDKTNTIDNVNITISMDIHLNASATLDDSLRYDITEYTKNYIEKTNTDNNLYASNLISGLLNNFSDIKYISFNNINNYQYNVQSIEKNIPSYNISQSGNMVNYVPEFLNVSKNYSQDSTSAEYNIDLQFK